MSRNWSNLDSDEERLPEGMQRIGYNADTSCNTFRDTDGTYWQSEEGSRYGELMPFGSKPVPMTAEQQRAMARNNRTSWRYLLPFFLLCAVFLLVVFKLLDGEMWGPSGMHSGHSSHPFQSINCPTGAEKYNVVNGDNCWDIAEARKTTVEGLMFLNQENGLDCNRLEAGKRICVPGTEQVTGPL